jgi:hypothetical protein
VNAVIPCLALASCVAFAQTPSADGGRFFDKSVAPILTKRCLGCHNDELKDGEISLLDRGSLLKGGGRGPAIVPGKPAESVLIHAIRHEGDLKMPPGVKLSAKEIATLTVWIKGGAAWGTKLRSNR